MLQRMSGVVLVILVLSLAMRAAPVPKGQVVPETLLDAECAVYCRFDGFAQHREAWNKTALAEIWRNGLRDVFGQLRSALSHLSDFDFLPESTVEHLASLAEGLWEKGFVVGVQVTEHKEVPVQCVLVLPGQAQQEKHLAKLLQLLAETQDGKVTTLLIQNRRIQQIQVRQSPWQVFWWVESDHLVLSAGAKPPHTTFDILEGKRPSLLKSEWYKEVAAGPEYDSCSRGYLYGKPLLAKLASQGPAWQKFVSASGLEDIPAITWHMGTEGRAVRSTVCVRLSKGPRRGLAKLFPDAQSGVEAWLQDPGKLPPLAPRGNVSVARFELESAAQQMRHLLELAVETFGGQEEADKVRQQLEEFLTSPLLKVLQELLPCLGEVWVSSDASADGLLSTGTILGVQLKDVPRARKVLARLKGFNLEIGRLEFQRRNYRGTELLCIVLEDPSAPFPALPIIPTLAIVDDWLLAALYPQPIQGVIARRDNKHWARWKPSPEAQKILASLNASRQVRLVGFSESDARGTMEFLGSWLPMIGGFVHAGTGGTFDATLLPPTQVLTEPLFPNVTVYLAEPDRLRIESYDSLPVPSNLLGWGLVGASALFEWYFE